MAKLGRPLLKNKLVAIVFFFLFVYCVQALYLTSRSQGVAEKTEKIDQVALAAVASYEVPYSSSPNLSRKCDSIQLLRVFDNNPTIDLKVCFLESILKVDSAYGTNMFWFFQGIERGVVEHLVALLTFYSPEEYLVVDLGLNIGFFSVVSALLGYTVHAFDIQPLCLAKSDEWLILNQVSERVHRYHIGLGNDKSMVIQVNKNQCGGTVGVNNQDASGVKVPTTTLDTVFWDDAAKRSRANIAVMKIDIEGAEPAAMQGASQLIKSHAVLNFIMEVNCHGNCIKNAVGMFQQLRSAGYVPYQLFRWVLNVDPPKATLANYVHPNGTGLPPYPGLKAEPHPLGWKGDTMGTSAWLIVDEAPWLEELRQAHSSANVWFMWSDQPLFAHKRKGV